MTALPPHLNRLPATAAALAAAAVCALAPSAANAASPTATFCVGEVRCPDEGIDTSLSVALSAAHAGAGPAEILIGPSKSVAPYVGPFSYSSLDTAGDNTVTLIGSSSP